jgi:ABC-type antimicrobial peptide transport system permease subunit
MRRVAVLMILGTASGWVLALALNKLLASVVELHAGRDVGLLVCVSLGLAAIGVLTSIAPARLAASIDPMQALRQD